MRASEFISEAKNGKVPKEAEQATKGIHKTRDVGGYDRTYHMNRMGMAMAMADGKSTKKVDMDSSSWVDKYNTIHPYTDEEDNMVKQAMKTVPTDHKPGVKKGRSAEPDDTHKVSPVTGFKGFK
jgi:hypothetical protein